MLNTKLDEGSAQICEACDLSGTDASGATQLGFDNAQVHDQVVDSGASSQDYIPLDAHYNLNTVGNTASWTSISARISSWACRAIQVCVACLIYVLLCCVGTATSGDWKVSSSLITSFPIGDPPFNGAALLLGRLDHGQLCLKALHYCNASKLMSAFYADAELRHLYPKFTGKQRYLERQCEMDSLARSKPACESASYALDQRGLRQHSTIVSQ